MTPSTAERQKIVLGEAPPSDKEKQAIRACFYYLGINPLPELRKGLNANLSLEWEGRKGQKRPDARRLWSLRIYTEGLNRRRGFVTLYKN